MAGRLLTTAVDVLQPAGDDVGVELATEPSSALRCLWAARMLRMRATIAWLWLRLARASFDVVVVVDEEDLDTEDEKTGGRATGCLCSAEDWTRATDVEIWLGMTCDDVLT